MITLTHGSDITASRNFLSGEKIKYPEKIVFDSTKNLTDIMQVLSGSGLFGDMQTLFLEGFITEKKNAKELEAIADFLNQQEETIFLWEPKELTAKEIKLFPKAVVKNFAIPKTVFAFVDSIAPNNAKKIITLYHEVLKNEDTYYVFAMLIRQIRILLALTEIADGETISEVKRLAPWQKGKLQKQTKAFSQEQLKSLHEKLFQLDLAQKIGKLALPLEKELDFFLTAI